MDLRISGKTAFVTGASKGIGAATARLLAAEGANVVVGFGRDGVGASGVARDITELGRRAWTLGFPMEDADGVRSAMETLSTMVDGLDMGVLNAGMNIVKPFDEVTFDEWDRVIQVNLSGTYYVLKSVLPLIRDGGSVVIVASVAAHTGVPHHPHYAAAKAGLINLTKSAARAMAPRVRVNCVAPGMTLTEMGDEALGAQSDDYARTKLLSHRYASPEEIATAIVYMASPAAGFIHGATLDINGGRYLR